MKAEAEKTEIIQSEDRVLALVLAVFSKARKRLDLSASYVGPRTGEEFVDALRSARKRGVRTRLLTDVTNENLKTMGIASRYLDIRHISGLKGNSWSVTDEEYVSSLSVGAFSPALPVIYSNAPSLVAEHQSIFDVLWSRGEPLDERIEALESGTDLPEVQILRDPERIQELYISLAKRATRQILLLLPTAVAFRRDSEIGLIRSLEQSAAKGVKVRLLTPVNQWVLDRLPKPQGGAPGRVLSFRSIPAAETRETITLLVVDHMASLTIDERSPSEPDFRAAVGSGMLATREPRVRQSISFFERIWTESELMERERSAREREEVSRKRAELMQDILTHDIRNFNQVARLNAELLGEQLSDHESARRISAILRAVDGSTKLIERAKKLGSIMAAGAVDLRPTSLRTSFERSMSLVRKGNPGVKIHVESGLTGQVLADELLDEVFVNILSNAVKYTDGDKVRIEVSQETGELQDASNASAKQCWKVSIADHGRGIPDSQKPSVFKRYLETANGSGLGLSVVHALVTDRYAGRAGVRNRVEKDFTKGTTLEVWLPKP